MSERTLVLAPALALLIASLANAICLYSYL